MSSPARPILSPPYPPYIDMGECKDCTLSWRMSRSEYTNWVIKKIPSGMSMPKRCPDCRLVRRQGQKEFGQKVRMQRSALGDAIRRVAEGVKDGAYEDNRMELALLLLDLAEQSDFIPEKPQVQKRTNEGK
jgi:hypothetical protein